ncbi:MAG TPA: GNAT family N-acetyltransferase [Candidatus Polarisedimenticolaceae bacterium]|nr:GNAT family N-acetyltransferase [Candidatus Polarisedimenticolaceae bacterium]
MKETLDAPPSTMRTERLSLRRPRGSDVEAVFAYASDPQVVRFMDFPRHRTKETAEAWLAGCQQAWTSGEEFTWLITLPPGDEAIGALACRLRGEDLDFGYILAREHWGRGYATEAARALVQWAWSAPGIRRVWATCDAENAASVRVLEKLGLRRDGLLPGGLVRPELGAEPRPALVYAASR